MQGQKHGSRLPHLWSIVVAVSVVSCGTDPDLQRLPNGQYETGYDPPMLTRSTPGCDRMLSRAFLVISARGTFELSINVIDDCSREGQGFSYFEILRSGGYYLDGSGLTFTPNAGAPTFAGCWTASTSGCCYPRPLSSRHPTWRCGSGHVRPFEGASL